MEALRPLSPLSILVAMSPVVVHVIVRRRLSKVLAPRRPDGAPAFQVRELMFRIVGPAFGAAGGSRSDRDTW